MRIILYIISCISFLTIANAIQIPTTVEIYEEIPFDQLSDDKSTALYGINNEGEWSKTIQFDREGKINLVFYTDGESNLTLIRIMSDFNQPIERFSYDLGIQPAGYNDLEIDLNEPDFEGFIYLTLMEINPATHKIRVSTPVFCAPIGVIKK